MLMVLSNRIINDIWKIFSEEKKGLHELVLVFITKNIKPMFLN